MRLVLFDIDGTLLTGGTPGRRSLTAAFQETFGIADIGPFMNQVKFNGRTDPVIIRDVARKAGIAADHLEEKLETLFETYLRHLRAITAAPHGSRVCPGVPELLEILEKRPGVLLGLLTGNIEPGARAKLEPFDLNRYFSAGGFGSDSEDRAEIAAVARRKFEVIIGRPIEAGHVLVVGDTEHDVACGRAHGFRTLAVGTGGVPAETLASASADLFFEDLSDVKQVVAAIEQLLELPATT